jgi:Zn-dependent peptidase ImmA (M78 family)
MTQAQLAEAVGVSRPTLIAIESGQRLPTELQLSDVSRVSGTSVRDLLDLAPPDPGLGVRFSALKNAGEASAAIGALEDYGRRYLRLEELAHDHIVRREPPAIALDRLGKSERAADELASTERLRLGLGDGPLPNLRLVFEEDAGLRIFGLRELGGSRISGLFAYSQDYGPLIGFNAANDARRIRWTLCHEYAHFLTERFLPEVTVDAPGSGRRDRSEAFADAFAARFLMPATGLSRRFSEMMSDAGGQMRVAHLVLLANFFEVSFAALTQRLEELGRIPRGTYEMLHRGGFKAPEAELALGITRHAPADLLPYRYIALVTRLYSEGVITEGDVVAYLHTDRLDARAILQRLPQSGDNAEVGLETEIEAVH